MSEKKKRIDFFFPSTLHANSSPKPKILFKKTQVLNERVLLFLAKKNSFFCYTTFNREFKHLFHFV